MRKIILLAILFCSSHVLAGKIYSYVDSNGVRHYTDKPPTYRSKVKIHEQPKDIEKDGSLKIYKYVDAKGTIHLTDKPNNSSYQLIYIGGVTLPSFSVPIGSRAKIHRKYSDYGSLIGDVANLTNLEPALLHAVIQTESAFNPKAVSPKGAVGLMQLMPATARRFGVKDRTDATENVYGGAKYLRHLINLFNNNLRLALAAYNAGENAVMKYGNKIPPYRETKHYVKKVMRLYSAYKRLM
ncbi:transglycosylase SLT domain-containing protein [Candidatus Halobeggiatoa sp. HSG11]|nr:transglycosylase SLT domain-containing protein [Candidatus Halobeggiatoa sp. HSG11]